jgi:hypothetical protein
MSPLRLVVSITFAGFLGTLIAGCAWDKPIPNTPSPGYPCGVVGVACNAPDSSTVTGCCGQYEVCGGPAFSGCPANMCCDVGGGDSSGGDAVAMRPKVLHPQTAPHGGVNASHGGPLYRL